MRDVAIVSFAQSPALRHEDRDDTERDDGESGREGEPAVVPTIGDRRGPRRARGA